MNILSLFGGIECGKVAAERAGISFEKYYTMHLHNDKLNIYTLVEFSKRNTSELINLKINNNEMKQELEALKKGILTTEKE